MPRLICVLIFTNASDEWTVVGLFEGMKAVELASISAAARVYPENFMIL
jgi:hypothetical protein